MKKRISISALRREMAQLRRDIVSERATATVLMENGLQDMAAWHTARMQIMENGLKWRDAAIRRELSDRKGVQHG